MGWNIVSNVKGFSSMKLARDKLGVTCMHCGRLTGGFAGGFARGLGGEPLCCPNVSSRPNCYELVTFHGHKIPCVEKVCYEDGR